MKSTVLIYGLLPWWCWYIWWQVCNGMQRMRSSFSSQKKIRFNTKRSNHTHCDALQIHTIPHTCTAVMPLSSPLGAVQRDNAIHTIRETWSFQEKINKGSLKMCWRSSHTATSVPPLRHHLSTVGILTRKSPLRLTTRRSKRCNSLPDLTTLNAITGWLSFPFHTPVCWGAWRSCGRLAEPSQWPQRWPLLENGEWHECNCSDLFRHE